MVCRRATASAEGQVRVDAPATSARSPDGASRGGHSPIDRSLAGRGALTLSVLAACASFTASPVLAVDFSREVRPVLAEHCLPCHGPDAAARQAGLRLDLRETATARGKSGRIPIVPGDPGSSEIIRRIGAEDHAVRMPPAFAGRPALAPEQIELLAQWIMDGAGFDEHWAFARPRRPAAPAVPAGPWTRRAIDRFVLQRLDAEGLTPSEDAEPAAWLRRMNFDLLGLPATWPETVAFVEDVARRGERAFEAAVDRALASPRYGERMALDWMDVARYADTHGYNNDSERSMWRWRDWVVDAFNRNHPYDRFIADQLAGDLMPNPTLDQRIATGFNRNHGINSEGGIIDEEYRVEYVADRVRTLGMAWLGITLECARCHDHRYDPISQRDYYRLYAFFNNQPEFGESGRVANAAPILRAPTASQAEKLGALRESAARLEREERRAADSWRPSGADLERLRSVQAAPAADYSNSCGKSGLDEVAGQACAATAADGAEVGDLGPGGDFTLTLWLHADGTQGDAPLVSAIDYEPDPASAVHGAGIQLRLTGNEVELRLSHRFPAYSITVRSDGANIRPDRWHHAAAVYASAADQGAMRARANSVRIFVDGREVGTRVLNDDLQSPAKFHEPLLVGLENGPNAGRFDGRIDELAIWRKALDDGEVRAAFQAVAVPWALDRVGLRREREWLHRALHPEAGAEAARRRLFAMRRAVPTTMVMREMNVPRRTRILHRGLYDAPGEPVDPGVPEVLLGTWPRGEPANRLGLAAWLTSPDHPTTARVVVNRLWQQLFGTGLVATSDDFGVRGEAPSHPALLDWLALEFVASGWDVKRLLREITLSSTYRQASTARPEIQRRDPDNRLLARGPRVRLQAEAIRDQALAVAGLLGSQIGGPSVRPYQPAGHFDSVVVGEAFPGTVWNQDQGQDLYRRSMYTFWKRTLPHPLMTAFDAPAREVCTARRATTNTPLQALALMNAPVFTDAAREVAGRLLAMNADGEDERIRALFRTLLGRNPLPNEVEALARTQGRLSRSYWWDRKAAEETAGESAGGRGSTAELAAYTALASLVLNLDEAITKQ